MVDIIHIYISIFTVYDLVCFSLGGGTAIPEHMTLNQPSPVWDDDRENVRRSGCNGVCDYSGTLPPGPHRVYQTTS